MKIFHKKPLMFQEKGKENYIILHVINHYSDITLRILFLICKSVILFICRFNNLTGFIFMTIDLEMPCFQLKII